MKKFSVFLQTTLIFPFRKQQNVYIYKKTIKKKSPKTDSFTAFYKNRDTAQ